VSVKGTEERRFAVSTAAREVTTRAVGDSMARWIQSRET
jgi:hypothetical protein